jgi:amino acid adenylation domain-containing protein
MQRVIPDDRQASEAHHVRGRHLVRFEGSQTDSQLTEILSDLWQSLLGVDPAGEPDLMRAGGSSLTLMEIQFSLNKRAGVLLDLDSIRFPVQFSGIVEHAIAASSSAGEVEPVRPEIEIVASATNTRSKTAGVGAWLIGTEADPPASLPSQVRSAAIAQPDAIAVREGELVLTYAELVHSADSLAEEIASIGSSRGRIAIIRCEPGIDYCIAVLAAITAGCFAAPLHPDLPVSRVDRIVAESDPIVVLGASVTAGIPSLSVQRRSGRGGVAGDPSTSPTTVHDPCYVLFTSGSTGDPKGVRMHQLPVANLARFEAERDGGEVGARTAQLAPLGFDVAFQEMFGTFAAGGELVVVPGRVRRDPVRLIELLAERRVTRVYCVPLLLRMIARASRMTGASLALLQEVVTAGEALRVDDDIRDFAVSSGGFRLVNQLGLAEAIQATHADLGVDPSNWPDAPEIGGPIPGVQIRIIDPSGRGIPRDEEGEIEIGGFATGLGYLGDSGNDRFREEDGVRWFRTGDHGVLESTGRLEFRGRRDNQVKIRGYRVELGDVERNIAALDFIEDAAVVSADGGQNGLELQAMVTTKTDRDEISIAEALAESLPPWMIPRRIRIVQELPSTSSGKIDRVTVARDLESITR